MNEMGGSCSTYGERRGAHTVLEGNPYGKRALGRVRRRWENNIKTHLLEVDLRGMDWIGLAQYKGKWWVLVNAVMNFRVP